MSLKKKVNELSQEQIEKLLLMLEEIVIGSYPLKDDKIYISLKNEGYIKMTGNFEFTDDGEEAIAEYYMFINKEIIKNYNKKDDIYGNCSKISQGTGIPERVVEYIIRNEGVE